MAPALDPLRSILAVRLDEGVGDGMDGVGVRRHVVLPCRKAAQCRPRWHATGPLRDAVPLALRLDSGPLLVGRTFPIARRGTFRCRKW